MSSQTQSYVHYLSSQPAKPTPLAVIACCAALAVASSFASVLSAQAPTLGTAANFGVLAGSTVTNTGVTIITGSVGVSPGTAITGFPPGTQTGLIHAGDAVAAQAQADAATAYAVLAGTACGTNLTGQDLGGMTLVAGVYCFSSSAQLTGTLTLDAQGVPDAVFIFQVGSALTTATGSAVTLINSACSCNVYWQIGSSATLGTGTQLLGHVLALASITVVTGSSISGSALALNGAVTLDSSISGGICCPNVGAVAPLGAGCVSGTLPIPALVVAAVPQIGGSGTVDILSPGTPSGVAFLLVGFDPTFSVTLGVALPLDLSPLGFVGCFLYSSGDQLTIGLPLDPLGSASYTFGIPKRFKFCDRPLTFQAVILGQDWGASNGVLATLGR